MISNRIKILSIFKLRAELSRQKDIVARLSNAALWGSIATIIGRGLPLLAMMLTARVLGPREFGNFSLLYSTAAAFEVFVTAGLAVTCTKFVADFHRTDRARTGRIIDLANVISLLSALLVGSALVQFAPRIASEIFINPELTNNLHLCAALVALMAFSGIQQGILVGLEAFKSVTAVEVVGGLGIFLTMPILAAGYGAKGAVSGLILAYALRLAIQYYAVTRHTATLNINRRWVFPKGEISIMWEFSVPAMLNSAVFVLVAWLAVAVIARQPNGPMEVGIFFAANQWFSILLFLPTILNQVAFPILTERLNAGDKDFAWQLFYSKVVATFAAVTFFALIVGIASPWVIGFYGVEYEKKWPVLLVVVLSAWISSPLGPMGNFLIAHAKQWTAVVANLVWSCGLILVVILFRDGGALTLAWAYTAAYFAKGVFVAMKLAPLRQRSLNHHAI